MVKKSVSKAVTAVSGTVRNLFNTQNILSSIIVLLLVVYMSFVNVSNVPRLLNNVIVKLLLFGLIVYTFYQDKMVSLILTATVILSISLAQSSKSNNRDVVKDNDDYPLVTQENASFSENAPFSENVPTPENVPVPVNDEKSLNTSINYQVERMI